MMKIGQSALLWGLFSIAPFAKAVTYSVSLISPPAGGDFATSAAELNDSGVVSVMWGASGATTSKPVLVAGSKSTFVEVPNRLESHVEAINSAGHIVGESAGLMGLPAGFYTNSTGVHLLPDTSGFGNAAEAINSFGDIAGLKYTGISTSQAVIWEDGKEIDIDLANATNSNAAGINNNRQVVGNIQEVPVSNQPNSFLWENGKVTLLPLDGNRRSTVVGINDSGIIVGGVENQSQIDQAAVWINGALDALGTLPGDGQSGAAAINNAGQVVGDSRTADYSKSRGFLYQNGKMTDINTLLPAKSGVNITSALDINNKGQILASSTTGNLYILAPQSAPPAVPLPASVWMGLFTLPGVWYARRRMLRGQAN